MGIKSFKKRGGTFMAKKKNPEFKIPRRKKNLPAVLLIAVLLIAALVCVLMALDTAEIIYVPWFHMSGNSYTVTEGTIEVHMIDVGQGDSILIMAPKGNVLIDAGDESAEGDLRAYLDSMKIEKIDYLILTHPDADHIGSADMVVNTYSVGSVMMEPYTYTSKTQTYKNLETAIETRSVTTIDPSPNDVYSLGDLHITILGPLDTYKDDKNNNSIVARLDYGETSFMMTGDAEKKSEKAMISQYGLTGKLRCNVLKVGHHGSTTSTSEDFLSSVKPQIAIISCGEGNKFGHPKQETLDKLAAAGVTVYRTDKVGTIILISDGKKVTYKASSVG